MPYPKSEAKIKRKIAKIRELEVSVGEQLIEIDKLKEDVGKYMEEENLKSLDCVVDEGSSTEVKLVAKKSERATITYDADALKLKLDKDVFMEVVDRIYTVTNINEMISLVKGAGISAKEFKGLLNVVQKPNNTKIKFLYDNGELTMKDLKGCFKAKISKTLKVVEETGDKN